MPPFLLFRHPIAANFISQFAAKSAARSSFLTDSIFAFYIGWPLFRAQTPWGWKGASIREWAGALGLAAPAKLKKTRGAAALA